MILLALLIFILGHLIPVWIFKEKFRDIRTQFVWKQFIYEISGVLTCFIIAFVIIVSISLISPKKYLLNENAIYGVDCGPVTKEMGFSDGDKIISINDQQVVRFSDIPVRIITESGDVSVKVRRSGIDTTIIITDEGKMNMIKSNSSLLFSPKLKPDSNTNTQSEKLVYTEFRSGLKESIESYKTSVKSMSRFVFPINSESPRLGGYVTISKITNLKGGFYLLGLNLLIIGLINLLPLPGLDIGNTIIALVEKFRKKKFNSHKMNIIRIVSAAFIVIFIITRLYLD